MFCFLSLLVFSFLGIFSATHRKFAREAFDCVFRRVTFKPCDTGFKEKVRGIVLSKLMRRSSFFAKIFNKHFELISWIFIILMLSSSIYVARGAYNFYFYGNCNGINEEGFCLFDPSGKNNKTSPLDETCAAETPGPEILTKENMDLENLFYLDNDSDNEFIFIACYFCHYSREAYPDVKKILDRQSPDFYFGHIPIDHEVNYVSKYDFCAQKDQQKYLDFVDRAFSSDPQDLGRKEYFKLQLQKSGYDLVELDRCAEDPEIDRKINERISNIESTNIYGTPLFFINDQALVGPKPYRVLKRFLK